VKIEGISRTLPMAIGVKTPLKKKEKRSKQHEKKPAKRLFEQWLSQLPTFAKQALMTNPVDAAVDAPKILILPGRHIVASAHEESAANMPYVIVIKQKSRGRKSEQRIPTDAKTYKEALEELKDVQDEHLLDPTVTVTVEARKAK